MMGLRESGAPNLNGAEARKYFAAFKSGSLELESDFVHEQDAKNWIVNLIKDFPSPDYAVIRNKETEETIFEEKNDA